jgi:hypothetical protein
MEAAADRMEVRIVQSRDHAPSARVDVACSVTAQAYDLGHAADRDEPLAADGKCPGLGPLETSTSQILRVVKG